MDDLKIMYIVRGISGSGKSTIAKYLSKSTGAEVCEADDSFITDDGNYDWNPDKLRSAHNRCLDRVSDLVQLGKDVIVSNTSLTEKELKPYLILAQQYGYSVQSILVQSLFKSIHGVTEHTLNKQKQKLLANILPILQKFLGD